MKHFFLILVLLAIGVPMLVACGEIHFLYTGAPVEEETTAEIGEFTTFADLKTNISLFADLVPITISTKGYYEIGDGGAATYRITQVMPTGIFEQIADNLWAVIETTAPVTPRQFGAYGDGINEDNIYLERAVAYAKAHNLLLVLPAGAEYYITAPLELSDVEIRSYGAKISYWGMQRNKPAVSMGNHTTIRGSLLIWSVDNGITNHGGRCGMGFGVYESGVGVSDCYVEEVIVSGGVPDANGILVTGDSHNIRIDRVIIPSGTNITRGILFHWGNASDHYPVNGEYVHKENWQPSTHPHDCSVGKVVCTDLLAPEGKQDRDNAAVAICACYNITIEEIECFNTYHAAEVTGADMGFEYASAAEKSHGQKNIRFGKITATGLRGAGLYLPGYPWYITDASAKSDLHFGTVSLTAGVGNDSWGVSLHGVFAAEFEQLTLNGFGKGGMVVANSTKNLAVLQYSFVNCSGSAVAVLSAEGTAHNEGVSRNLVFTMITADSDGGANVPLLSLRSVSGVAVKEVLFLSGTWSAVAELRSATEVTVGTVRIEGSATVGQTIIDS